MLLIGCVTSLILGFLGSKATPPMMTFLMRRMNNGIVACPRCGAVYGAGMRRAVPRRAALWLVTVAAVGLFFVAGMSCLIGGLSALGQTGDRYVGPAWYLGAFAVAAAMFLGGVKIASWEFTFPVIACTACGYRAMDVV